MSVLSLVCCSRLTSQGYVDDVWWITIHVNAENRTFSLLGQLCGGMHSAASASGTSAADLGAGGVVILAEEFSHEIYRKSLARLFELDESGHLQMYFNATLDVVASKVSLSQHSCILRVACCTGMKDNSPKQLTVSMPWESQLSIISLGSAQWHVTCSCMHCMIRSLASPAACIPASS